MLNISPLRCCLSDRHCKDITISGRSQRFSPNLLRMVATRGAICDKTPKRLRELSQIGLKRKNVGKKQRRRKMPFVLAIQKNLITFAAVNLTTKRHLASWLLLAVFLPMLVFSSLHVHEGAVSQAEKDCIDCTHHNCHGHLTQTTSWAHDCVLCQFLTLTMLTAAAAAVIVYIHVGKSSYSQPLCSHHAACCGNIVTRGPPSA